MISGGLDGAELKWTIYRTGVIICRKYDINTNSQYLPHLI